VTGSRSPLDPFEDDIAALGGYVYTTKAGFSSMTANRRITKATLALIPSHARSLLDLGCGDGEYTVEIARAAEMDRVVGVEPSLVPLRVALQKGRKLESIRLAAASAYELPFRDASFDVGYLRGVLHHLDHPIDALREALRTCAMVVIVEPNGYSPVLKFLERASRYHREHNEKSYSPAQLDRWICSLGGRVLTRSWAGLVPMFCPTLMARMLKRIEPLVELLTPLNRISCAVYVVSATKFSL
jgi:ubiquinone/menaquinone biosynthesis C-methylase UbiE